MRTLVWFRGKDLRVADHAPLRDAAAAGDVIPLFVLDPAFFARARARAMPHRMQVLGDALAELAAALERRGSRLLVVRGRSVDVVPRLARRWRVDRVVAHAWVEPFARARDRRVAAACTVPFDLYDGVTLVPPGSVRTGAGTPYSVFTPFARNVRRRLRASDPLPAPRRLPPVPADIRTRSVAVPTLANLGLTRNPHVPRGGETAARRRLCRFLRRGLRDYATERERPDHDGTSRLGIDLKFGALSVRAVWHAVHDADAGVAGPRTFGTELLWREFALHVLWDRPHVLRQPFRDAWRGFPWRRDATAWDAWATGHTGIPIVDAGARQLCATGFVHNRVRMIAACWLTKQCGIDYRRGEAHYARWLADGDWAPNNLGWQWSAGCGCDAQPWFRVFNPVTQGRRFDPEGAYVRRWVPELRRLPTRWIHAPWTAPDAELVEARCTLGIDYPRPVVDPAIGRARFLATARRHLGRARQ